MKCTKPGDLDLHTQASFRSNSEGGMAMCPLMRVITRKTLNGPQRGEQFELTDQTNPGRR